MHHKCHQQYIQTSYQCPTCSKALADMKEYYQRIDEAIVQHKMPKEYENTYSHIYCNDCEKKSHAKYHFLYHKCGHCNVYNTKVLQTTQELPPDAVIAPPVTLENTFSNLSIRPSIEVRSTSESSMESVPSLQSNAESSVSSSSSRNRHSYWCHQCQVSKY